MINNNNWREKGESETGLSDSWAAQLVRGQYPTALSSKLVAVH